MMRKAVKYFPVFFMLLAWMVLTAHQIIPHDHHLSDSLAGKEQKCPVSDSRPDHHKGFPLHCHAFNDLSSEKVVKFVLANYIHFTLFSSGGFSFPIHAESQYLTIRVTSQDLPDYCFMDFSFLRAPPSFS